MKNKKSRKWLYCYCALILVVGLFVEAIVRVDAYTDETRSYDTLIFSENSKDRKENALNIYNDNTQIAKEDYSYNCMRYDYYNDEEKLMIGKLWLTGSSTLLIADVKKDITLDINYEVGKADGKLKLCLIAPDGTVTTIMEGAGTYKKGVNLKKGRNCLKLVGQKAYAKKLKFTAGKPDSTVLNSWYNEEGEEKAQFVMDQVNKGGKLNLDDFVIAAPYMEEEDVGRALIYAYKSNLAISDSKLTALIPFVDDDFSDFFIQYVKSGKSVTFKQLSIMAPFITEECVDELLFITVDEKTISMKELELLLPFASEEALGKMVNQMLKNGKRFDSKELKKIAPFVDEEDLSNAVQFFIKDGGKLLDSDLYNLAPFLDEDLLDDLVDDLIKSNHSFTFNEINNLAPYLNEDTLGKMVNQMLKNGKHFDSKELEKIAPFVDEEDLSNAVQFFIKDGGKLSESDLYNLAPFLDEDLLDDLVDDLIKSNHSFTFNEISKLAPYLSEDTK